MPEDLTIHTRNNKETHEAVASVWERIYDPATYNDKQMAMLLLLHENTIGMQLVLVDDNEKNPLLYVRGRDGVLHRGDAYSSAYCQNLHGWMADHYRPLYAATDADVAERKANMSRYQNWIQRLPEQKTWYQLEDQAYGAYFQLTNIWDYVPEMERITYETLAHSRIYVGVGNGVLDVTTGKMMESYEQTYVLNKAPWNFNQKIWDEGMPNCAPINPFFPVEFMTGDVAGLPEWQQKQYEAWKQLAYAFLTRMEKTYLAFLTVGDAGKSTMLELLEASFKGEILKMPSSALFRSRTSSANQANPELFKLSQGRMVFIEEPGTCSPEMIRELSAAPTVIARDLYKSNVVLPIRATMVFLGNPDEGKDPLGISNFSDAGEATAARGRFVPMDQVPKTDRVECKPVLRNKIAMQVLGHRFLRLVHKVAMEGDPGESAAMEAAKTVQRTVGLQSWKRDVVPLMAVHAHDEETEVHSGALYTIFQMFCKDMQLRIPNQHDFTQEFERQMEIRPEQCIRRRRRSIPRLVGRDEVVWQQRGGTVYKGISLSEDAQDLLDNWDRIETRKDEEGFEI